MRVDKPYLWVIDSPRRPLAESMDAFAGWADAVYVGPDAPAPDWEPCPDAILFSAELPGGAGGAEFQDLLEGADRAPLLAVARTRSLGQALSYFRAGAVDYLSLPLDPDETGERVAAALEKAERMAMASVLAQVETVEAPPVAEDEEDILSAIPADNGAAGDDDEPVAVDGLPIPMLWEELPCGLLVFDSDNNLVFSNSLGLDLFGHASIAELQDALENDLGSFAAHGANHKPLAGNRWPHILAQKTRTARSAVISIAKPDRRRLWLRCDCLPHVADGKVNRLTMTLVNLTGELPALAPPAKKEPAKRKSKKKK